VRNHVDKQTNQLSYADENITSFGGGNNQYTFDYVKMCISTTWAQKCK